MHTPARRWLVLGVALGCAVMALLVLAWPRPSAPPPARGRSLLALDRMASSGIAPAPNGSQDELPRTDRRIILIMGLDEVQGSHRADTLLLASVGLHPPRVALVSIPRDLRVRLPGRGWNKINAAYAYGGPSLTVRAVEDLLGIPVDYYLAVDYEAFRRLVDQLGGIHYTVEQRMYHVDRAQGRVINLQPGPQRLDGERALQYVRYRGDGRGDTGRVMRQQQLLRAAIAQWRTPGTLARLPLLVPNLIALLRTNVSVPDAIQLAGALRQVPVEELRVMTVPGVSDMVGGVAYIVADPAEVRRSVRAFLQMPAEAPQGGMPPVPVRPAPSGTTPIRPGQPAAPQPGTVTPARSVPRVPEGPPARRGPVP